MSKSTGGNMSAIEELANSLDLPIVDTEEVIAMLEHDILIDLYRKNPDSAYYSEEDRAFNHQINKNIKAAYEKKYGVPFTEDLLRNHSAPFCLNGAPGQGKTTAYVVAAQNVCKELGLNFIRDVEESYVPSRKDFLFVVQDSAGKTSTLEYALPRAVTVTEKNAQGQDEENYYLKSALNWRFMCLNKAAGGVLLFDDAANASINVQNSFLQVAINKTFGGMKLHAAHIGFTGNLGAADGTYTNSLGSAFRNRVVMLFVRDTVDNFVKRAYAKYNTSIGDLGIINYLTRNTDDLSSLPKQGSSVGFNSPRSWDDFISKFINTVIRHGGRGRGEEASMKELRVLANSFLGPVVGKKVVSYYNSLMLGADPIAKEAIYDKLNMDKFKAKYGTGGTAEAISFGYQYANACGDYTTNMVREKINELKKTVQKTDPKYNEKVKEILTDVIGRFAKAIMPLIDNEVSYGLTHLKSKLAAGVEGFGKLSNDGATLDAEFSRQISFVICAHPDVNPERRKLIIKVISGANMIQQQVELGEGGGGARVRTRTRGVGAS